MSLLVQALFLHRPVAEVYHNRECFANRQTSDAQRDEQTRYDPDAHLLHLPDKSTFSATICVLTSRL